MRSACPRRPSCWSGKWPTAWPRTSSASSACRSRWRRISPSTAAITWCRWPSRSRPWSRASARPRASRARAAGSPRGRRNPCSSARSTSSTWPTRLPPGARSRRPPAICSHGRTRCIRRSWRAAAAPAASKRSSARSRAATPSCCISSWIPAMRWARTSSIRCAKASHPRPRASPRAARRSRSFPTSPIARSSPRRRRCRSTCSRLPAFRASGCATPSCRQPISRTPILIARRPTTRAS